MIKIFYTALYLPIFTDKAEELVSDDWLVDIKCCHQTQWGDLKKVAETRVARVVKLYRWLQIFNLRVKKGAIISSQNKFKAIKIKKHSTY